jgi:HK97 family phage prohead protease
MSKEFRIFTFKPEVRSADSPQISGYAAVFNTTADLGMFRERIKPGAFTRAIQESQDVRCLFNHDADYVLGRTKSGTLRLSEDDQGLRFECDMPNTQMGRDVREMILRGDVDQCSFGFVVTKENVSYNQDGTVDREIQDVDLFDVSPVTYPAYTETSVEARSRDEALKKIISKRDEKRANAVGCECDCEQCVADNCPSCSDPNCTDANCQMERSRQTDLERERRYRLLRFANN